MTLCSRAGLTAALLAPWLLAGAGFTLAALGWLRAPGDARETGRAGETEPEQVKALRLALDTAQQENETLRRELDRLLDSVAGGEQPAGARAPATSPPSAQPKLSRDEVAQLIEELEDEAARAAGDPAAMQEMRKRIMALLANGRAAFPSFLDAYMNVREPRARSQLLPAMLFTGGREAIDFITQQAEVENDPHLKSILVSQAAKYATPQVAKRMEATFAQTLDSASDPEVRKLVIQGLSRSRGEEATAALVRAASAPEESVRLAAIDALATRYGARDELRRIIASDAPESVRRFAECRVLVADQLMTPSR